MQRCRCAGSAAPQTPATPKSAPPCSCRPRPPCSRSLSAHDDDLEQSLRLVRDAATAAALRGLAAKLERLEDALLSQMDVPPSIPVDVAAEGLGFSTDVALAPGTTLAVHLVLPPVQHVIGRAVVSRCAVDPAAPERYAVGVTLTPFDAAAARRLTRYVIRSRD
ncbi:MAG: hypothetical protein R3E86_19705 [Pseudomonadales bacterium]